MNIFEVEVSSVVFMVESQTEALAIAEVSGILDDCAVEYSAPRITASTPIPST